MIIDKVISRFTSKNEYGGLAFCNFVIEGKSEKSISEIITDDFKNSVEIFLKKENNI